MTDDARQDSEFTRRSLLRNSFLLGAGAAVAAGASASLSSPARAAAPFPIPPASTANPATPAPQQWDWVWCKLCAGIFNCVTAGSSNPVVLYERGWCPEQINGYWHANTAAPYNSDNYGLYYTGAGASWQPGWFWCHNCKGLFYGSGKGYKSWGKCPYGESWAGDVPHQGDNSYDSYLLYYGGPVTGYQSNWLWCKQCDGLFYGGSGSSFSTSAGVCPVNGGLINAGVAYTKHDGSGSYNYSIPWNGSIDLILV
jgi:hypothetical protein